MSGNELVKGAIAKCNSTFVMKRIAKLNTAQLFYDSTALKFSPSFGGLGPKYW